MNLREMREHFSEQASRSGLARKLRVRAPYLVKLESQQDMLVSTLRRYVEGLGGRLELRAQFVDQDTEVVITQFDRTRESTRRKNRLRTQPKKNRDTP